MLTVFKNGPNFRFLSDVTKRFKPKKLVLGIESTFDDSGAAVIDESGNVLGESLRSQVSEHRSCGGVRPDIAQKLHEQNIPAVVSEAMARANVEFKDLSALATATCPGFSLSLKEGLMYSKKLVRKHNLPFIPVHHMEAHTLTARSIEKIDFPFLTLLASGGHCILCLCQGLGSYKILGETLDEPPGAVFDKVARWLGVFGDPNYSKMSGGKAIELLAKEGESSKIPFAVPLSHNYNDRTMSCNFSLSGLQSQVRSEITLLQKDGCLGLEESRGVAAGFQEALVKHILTRLHRAIIFCKRKELLPQTFTLVISGGVASNNYLRSSILELCGPLGVKLVCPPHHLCTDNGIMIAWTGMEYLLQGKGIVDIDGLDEVDFEPRSALGEYIGKQIVDENIKVHKIHPKKKKARAS